MEGPRGPAGVAGEQGPRGEKGDAGDKGDKGDSGNANVKVYTKDISSANWEREGSYLILKIKAPNILTRDVLDNHTILTYVRSTDHSSWSLLPYLTHRGILVEVDVELGEITLQRSQNGAPTTQSRFSRLKLVIIGQTSSEELNRSPDIPVDYEDYEAVKKYYNFKD